MAQKAASDGSLLWGRQWAAMLQTVNLKFHKKHDRKGEEAENIQEKAAKNGVEGGCYDGESKEGACAEQLKQFWFSVL